MGIAHLSEDILRTATSPWVLQTAVDCKNKLWESCVHPRSLVIEKTRTRTRKFILLTIVSFVQDTKFCSYYYSF